MSGHSKWSTIKHRKSIADQRRGREFSKLAKAISLAAREGNDPDKNFKLRLIIEKAKQVNMPKSNIERAIDRGSGGGGGGQLEAVVYEGFGPQKIGVMIEAVTDNRNRTTAEIKNLFEKNGGSLASPGGVTYMFEKIGQIILKKPADSQQAMLKIIDLGVENVEEGEAGIEVYVEPGQLETITDKLIQEGFDILEKDLIMQPKNLVVIKGRDKHEKVIKFMEVLESHEDVQKTFANFDLVD